MTHQEARDAAAQKLKVVFVRDSRALFPRKGTAPSYLLPQGTVGQALHLLTACRGLVIEVPNLLSSRNDGSWTVDLADIKLVTATSAAPPNPTAPSAPAPLPHRPLNRFPPLPVAFTTFAELVAYWNAGHREVVAVDTKAVTIGTTGKIEGLQSDDEVAEIAWSERSDKIFCGYHRFGPVATTASKKPETRYPHVCPRCEAPAYLGGGPRDVKCSRTTCMWAERS